MNKKNRLRGIAAGIFCAGVLLGGVGTGIAFTEFSSFAYQEIPVPQEAFKEEIFHDYVYEEDGEKVRLRDYFCGVPCRIKEQEDIPVDSVEVAVVYNAELCEVGVRKEQDGEGGTWLRLYLDTTVSNMGLLMKYKDGFLDGLKNRELRDYEEKYIESVEYRINPESRGRFVMD